MVAIADRQTYLERMGKPLQEKLKIVKYFPSNTRKVLDVGCADGQITIAMASLFPQIQFLGIDLDKQFIDQAKKNAEGQKNVDFKNIYLRDLLAQEEQYDVVSFISVLHEFYSYGEGLSSVVKACADAHELLADQGVVVIRDMILSEFTKQANLKCKDILDKIYHQNLASQIKDFEQSFGGLNSVYQINHFLLKYWYKENWSRESKEHYVPVTFEQYNQIFELLDMQVQVVESYLMEFLRNKWKEDFLFTDDELELFKSTGIMVAQKV